MEEELEKRKSNLKNFFFGWIKDNYDKAFLLLLAVAFGVGLWIFFLTKGQPVWYDTANFLSTAQKWALGLDHINDIWYYRRGFFWVLFSAFFFKQVWEKLGFNLQEFYFMLD